MPHKHLLLGSLLGTVQLKQKWPGLWSLSLKNVPCFYPRNINWAYFFQRKIALNQIGFLSHRVNFAEIFPLIIHCLIAALTFRQSLVVRYLLVRAFHLHFLLRYNFFFKLYYYYYFYFGQCHSVSKILNFMLASVL